MTDLLLEYPDLIDRVDAAASLVDAADQASARRVVAIGRELSARPRRDGAPTPGENDAALRRELNRAFELLGRRGARALPAAALARALLADLSGSRRDFREALGDCQHKLLMFGL